MHQDPYYHNDNDYDIITQPNYMLLDPEENPMDSYNDDHDLYASGYKTRSNGEQRDRTRWDPKSHRAMKPSRPARRNITFADDEEYIEPPQSQQSQGIQAVNTPTQVESSTVQQAGPSNIQQSVPVQSTSPQRPAPNQSTQHSTPTNQQSASTRRTIPEVRSTSTVPRRTTQVETRDTEMSEATPTTRVTQATQAGVSHTKPKKKRVPREKPIIDYDVVDDVMNRVANITIQDLVKLVPAIRRQLHGATSIRRKKPKPKDDKATTPPTQNLTLIDGQKRTFESTAAYATFYVCGVPVRALIDTGASMTCISRTFADDIGLKINAPSSARFTLGNATQQASLGIIFDVPLRPGNKITIPINVEVLGRCPVPLIVGNNWFTRAHAIINFAQKTLSLRVAKVQVSIPISYVKEIIKAQQDRFSKQPYPGGTPGILYSSDNGSETSSEDYPSSDSSSDSDDSSSTTTDGDTQNESSDSIYFLEQDPEEKPEVEAEAFIEDDTIFYGLYAPYDIRVPPGETEIIIGNLPMEASEDMIFESPGVPYVTIDRRISGNPISNGDTRFTIFIENNRTEDLIIYYGEPIGDYVPDRIPNDDVESAIGYEFAPPAQSTLITTTRDEHSQELFPMTTAASTNDTHVMRGKYNPQAQTYEVISHANITIPPRDQVHIYGEMEAPVHFHLRFKPEEGMRPEHFHHHYFGRDIEPGETEFKITIVNELNAPLIIPHPSFIGTYHFIRDDDNQEELQTPKSKTQQLPDEYRDRFKPPDIDDPEIKDDLYKLLGEYQDIFDWDGQNLGRTHLMHHKIETEDVQPIRARPYRLAPVEADALKQELDKLCKLRVIRPSTSPWASPVILVKKKNGDYRLVIDYRKLNTVTKKDSYPLPRIDDLLDALGNAKIFSALDLRSGFNQVPLHPDSIEKTAFVCKEGVYENLVLPQGCANSPRVFQRLVDICLRPLINKCVVAYIDDINIYSKTPKEHINHLRQTFDCIRMANLTLNPDKCIFFKKSLQFLGFIITADGVGADEEKISKIKDFPRPKTVTQLRSFLGLCSFYRKHVPNFARIARPLHSLTKKEDTPWTPKATEAFERLKTALTTPPILARPDFDKPFILATDASREGLGAVLSQLGDDNKERPILYLSRGLNKAESNYGISKLECLAAVWAIRQLRPYLLGKKFKLITDHSALRGLLNQPNPTGILARWIAFLSEFEFETQYRPGRVHNNADFLSRLGY